MAGSSELGSSGAELGQIELAGITADSPTIDLTISDVLSVSESWEYQYGSDSGSTHGWTDVLIPHSSFSFSLHRHFDLTLSNILVINESFSTTHISGSFKDTLVPVDFFTIDKVINLSFSDLLYPIDSMVTEQQLTYTLTDNLDTLIDSWILILIHNDPFNQINKFNPFIYLQSLHGSITLEAPNFGDIQANISDVIISRMVDGTRYSYLKKTRRKHLKYEMNLRCNKYEELEAFIDNSIIDDIILINWKNEIWSVKIVNEPIVIEASSRDLYKVSIEFEGYLKSSGDYQCLE